MIKETSEEEKKCIFCTKVLDYNKIDSHRWMFELKEYNKINFFCPDCIIHTTNKISKSD